MHCKKCGEKVNDQWNYCPNCNSSLMEDSAENNEEKTMETKNKEPKDAKAYIIAFVLGLIGMFVLKPISGLCFIVALVSIVTGYIKCPNSIITKIFFWLFVIFVILSIVFFVAMIFMCVNMTSSCPG